ncbi:MULTISPECIES: MarR family winged helix-turn-helix transcriptional regulator [unclassified Leucobacter]|uniref:MarR family winged helix-turn-helix transcriptional regulator n=1 Tax=unclassified Leucobacter TaxID=2621730 RepID=UPI00165E2777|nr:MULTISPECIES: MarR family transcriptional regulator [unclassified Leucobacter]MBC9935985.1 MarR family transcriptional regulator [Leucobacter sp. cx-87]
MSVTNEMVCFSLYAATRATTQAYRQLLEPWNLTYPQYLVLATLWIEGEQTVSSLGEHLQLDSGTLSPLLRRMEQGELVHRERRGADERVVTVSVGARGLELRAELAHIPGQIAAGTGLTDRAAAAALIETLQQLTETMHAVSAHPTNDTIAITTPKESHK